METHVRPLEFGYASEFTCMCSSTLCAYKSIHKQQTTIRQPIECAPEASSGVREWAEMTEGFHLEATRRRC